MLIAEGVTLSGGIAKLRTVPDISTDGSKPIPATGDAIYCSEQDLISCDGLALGSPTRFGNMAAPLKFFWDNTSTIWLSGALQGKPGSVFTSTGSMHGGQETTLISMMLPLLHHGMLIMGLPYQHGELSTTVSGGTPYGASHLAGARHEQPISKDEKTLAIAQGKRLANIARQLKLGSA